MRRVALSIPLLLISFLFWGQQKEAVVTYDRIIKSNINFPEDNLELGQIIPRFRSDTFELSIAKNKSVWKMASPANTEFENPGERGFWAGLRAAEANRVLYFDLDKLRFLEQKGLFDKTVIVADSLRNLSWRFSDETKNVLNYVCRKAMATTYGKKTVARMEEGKVERKEEMDTTNVIAWYTSEIPFSAGPEKFQGQLPGLILEMNINNGRQIFKAISISGITNTETIKEIPEKKLVLQKLLKKKELR